MDIYLELKNTVSEVVCWVSLVQVKVWLHDCSNGPSGTLEVGNFILQFSSKSCCNDIDKAK